MVYEGKKYDRLRVFISGQKFFGAEVFRLCNTLGCDIVGVCAPMGDKYLLPLARRFETKIIVPGGGLNHATMPDGVDLGIAAHSFDYVGKKTRYKTGLGWIGFHPSLLPRHRGKSAIEWSVRMRDFATGGSVFWLNAGVDRGDVLCQDWFFIDPKYYAQDPMEAASEIWRDQMLPLGVRLFEKAITEIKSGKITRIKQDARFSTFEPSTGVRDIFRPDLELLPERVDAPAW